MSEKFRIEKKSNFTVVSNDILMNNYMSMKATCLLMKMLGKPDNWDYTINGMKTFCVEGRDAIRSALKELEKFGFLERRKVRDSRGRYTDIEYIIYRVGKEDKPAAVVKSRLLKLERHHLEYVLDCFRKNTTEIRNIRAYLLTSLYNSYFSSHSGITAQVQHDLYGKGGDAG